MAKKRKTRPSEDAQPQSQKPEATEQISAPEPEPEPEPDPEPEPEPIHSNQEAEEPIQEEVDPDEEVEEEVEEVEEVEEEEDEDEDEDEEGEQNAGDEGGGLEKQKEADGGSVESKQVNGGAGSGELNNDGEDDEDEPFEKLLEPFSKDQMVVLLNEAVTKHPTFMESVRKLADADPAHRKIFVHGLGWDTTAETLTSVFGKYGEIEDCKAVTDKVSGKSKGYGFILFKHRSGARKALKQPQKKIGNRMTSCQLASTGPVPAPPPSAAAAPVSEYTQRKIFVSNVSADLDPQKLLDFFSKFGEIEEGPLGLDKHTGKPKGFCLFVYKSLESAKRALEEPHKNFEGHTLHCQKAIDGPKPSKSNYPQQQQHYGGTQQHHQQQHQQQYYGHQAKKGKYSGGSGSGPAGSTGHLMAPAAGPTVGFNPAVAAAPALTPALGQALTALLASQGAGLGIGNLLGGLGAPVNQGVPPVMNNAGYGGQGAGGYGAQPGMQGGFQNPQMGSQAGVRPQQGGYMGHGH